MPRLKRLMPDDRGATAIEYGLIMALMAVAAIAAFSNFGTELDQLWAYISTKVVAALSS